MLSIRSALPYMIGFQRRLRWSLLAALIVTIFSVVRQTAILMSSQSQVMTNIHSVPRHLPRTDYRRGLDAIEKKIAREHGFVNVGVSAKRGRKNENDEDSGGSSDTSKGRSSNNSNNKKRNNIEKRIREWGCDRTETPLIFVHNGKMGGGAVRARLAASAINFNRTSETWNQPYSDRHYYPIRKENGNRKSVGDPSRKGKKIRKGKFCNSKYPHYTMIHPRDLLRKPTFEGSQFCNATTPFGIAIACPHPYKKSRENLLALISRRDKKVSKKQYGQKSTKKTTKAHYLSLDCRKCDDDYYLDEDFYFDNVSSEYNAAAPVVIPLPKTRNIFNPKSDPHPGHTCDIVLASHTNIGSELHWLPPRYLKEHWWDNSIYGRDSNGDHDYSNELEKYWATLLDDRHHRRRQLMRKVKEANDGPSNGEQEDTSTRWCPSGYYPKTKKMLVEKEMKYDRPSTEEEYLGAYETCGITLAQKADKVFRNRFYPSDADYSGKPQKLNYSPFYASMPLHRITLMRDPWSWVVSKFFWHKLDKFRHKRSSLPCEDLTLPSGYEHRDPFTGRQLGWCESFSMFSLMKLCGNDCHIRYENKMMSLEEIEDQVESNLRNAFSVVGLLNETESFYDMITDRIDYVNLTYNPEIVGTDHATKKTIENIACKKLFEKDEKFRESVRQRVPAFAALERIYHVAVEVNRFQKQELQQCRRSKGGTPTKGVYGTPAPFAPFAQAKMKK